MRIHVLGIPLDDLGGNPARVRGVLEKFLESDQPHLVVTPNAEFAMSARKDPTFRAILNRADLALADGIGMVLAARWLRAKRIRRLPGPELVDELCTVAEQLGSRVFLLGGQQGVAQRAARTLVRRHPGLQIVGTESGFRGWGWRLPKHDLIRRIAATRADILLVALGAPRQEKWIAHHLWELPTVRVAVGVGGTLDYLSGRLKRAPLVMRRIGLEWLWRVLLEPWRWPRILTATVRFSWVVFWTRVLPHREAAW